MLIVVVVLSSVAGIGNGSVPGTLAGSAGRALGQRLLGVSLVRAVIPVPARGAIK